MLNSRYFNVECLLGSDRYHNVEASDLQFLEYMATWEASILETYQGKITVLDGYIVE